MPIGGAIRSPIVEMGLAPRELGVVPNEPSIVVELTVSEIGLLTEALDSHEYWQLSDPLWRNSGYVILPGEDIGLSDGRPLDAAQYEAATEILEARQLQERLRLAAGRE